MGSCSTTSTVLPWSLSFRRTAEQPRRVPGVEPDRRLVEHVEGAGEPRAQGAGEVDALGLTSRQGLGLPVQGQVVQPDVQQVGDAASRSP